MPYDGKAFVACEECGRNQRRIVEVHELEPLVAEGPPELVHVARQADELAAEEEPAAPPGRRRPDVSEAGDRSGMDDGSGLAKEIGCRPRRAIHVRLELLAVELANEVRQR